MLLAEVEGKSLSTFAIDAVKQEMTIVDTIAKPSGVVAVKRSARYFALIFPESVTFLLANNIKKEVVLKEVSEVELSILDDVALVGIYKEKVPRLVNIASQKEETLPAVTPGAGCKASRVRESERVDHAQRDQITYAV